MGGVPQEGGAPPTRLFFLTLLIVLLLAVVGCSREKSTVRLITSPELKSSGLMTDLEKGFETAHPDMDLILSTGTNREAINAAAGRKVDAVISDASAAADAPTLRGWKARAILHTDLVLVGPEKDPAGVVSAPSASEALARLSIIGAEFISRGDNSVSHRIELSLWKESGVDPKGSWYIPAVTGTDKVIGLAEERQAYALVNRGAFIQKKAADKRMKLSLLISPERKQELDGAAAINYFVLVPTGQKRNERAETLLDWLSGKQASKVIESAGKERGLAIYAAGRIEPAKASEQPEDGASGHESGPELDPESTGDAEGEGGSTSDPQRHDLPH